MVRVAVVCEVMDVGLVDLEVIVLELDSSFEDGFCLELGGVEEWTSGGVVKIMQPVVFGPLPRLNKCLE